MTFASGPGQPTQNINFYLGWMRLYAPAAPGPNDLIIARTRASNQGVWTHYALTRDAAGQLRIFVNGVEDIAGTNPFTGPFHLGFIAGIDGGSSEADFADFRVWSVARTESQIATFRSARLDETTPGLERLYRFEGSATDVLDATGNSAAASIPAGGAIVSSPDAPVASPPAVTPQPGPNADLTVFVYDHSVESKMDNNDVILQFEVSTAQLLTRRWLHSANVDEPLEFESYSSGNTPGTGSLFSLVRNRIGSVIAVVSLASSSIAAEYEYDGFGSRLATIQSVQKRYGYTGREHDSENDLIYFRARHYDVLTGRFLQQDPIGFGGGDENLYAYVSNNPKNSTDPSGLSELAAYRAMTAMTAAAGAAAACTASTECQKDVSDIAAGWGAVLLGTIGLTESITKALSTFPPLSDGEKEPGPNDDGSYTVNTPWGPMKTWSSTKHPDPEKPEPPEEPWWVKLIKMLEKIMKAGAGG